MKKIFIKSILCLFIGGAFVSCENELDQLPYNSFATENAFVSASDFENGIRGVYQGLLAGGLYGGTMLSTPDVLSDNVTLSSNGRQTQAVLHSWDYNGNATLAGLYDSAYTLIYRANQVLGFAENFDGPNKAKIVAEAKALRALAHFDLVTYFGKIPTQSSDANSSLGVAYVFIADASIEPARNTVDEVYANIVTDLTEAVGDMPTTSGTDGRMNRDAVNLLLSRVYLYMGQWQNSIDAALAVSMPIAARANVVGIYDDTSQDGLVFSIPNVAPILGNQIGVNFSQGPATAIILEYVPSFEIVSLYASDDIRKDASIFPATFQGAQYNAIRKLFGRPGQNNGVVDYKIFRAAEAALNASEAYYRLGNEDASRTQLDRLRTRRYTSPPSGETGTALLSAINLERRLEFAFEGQRFFDIKRQGLAVERESFGDLRDGSGQPSIDLTLPAGSLLFQLPISTSTITINPNIVQNPGY